MMGRKGTYPAIPATKKPRKVATRKQAPLPPIVSLFVSFADVATFYQFSNAWKARTGFYFEPMRVPTSATPDTYRHILVTGVDNCDRVRDLANEITGVGIENEEVSRVVTMLENAKRELDVAIAAIRENRTIDSKFAVGDALTILGIVRHAYPRFAGMPDNEAFNKPSPCQCSVPKGATHALDCPLYPQRKLGGVSK